MKKSRTKFLSVFAILFVAIFAVSCCFFAACKGGSDDGGNSGDTGTQQGDDTGSGSGDDSGSGSGTDGSGSDSGTDDGSESGPSQTVTKVVYLATSSDVEYTTAGEAVFENGSDLEITTSDGLTYTVSGTASVMGEAEAAWYATDDVEEGTPYVVIKIAVAEGESIYFENSEKTYTNDEEGAANFDKGYIFIVCKLSFEDGKCVTETKYDITPVEGESVTYTVSFSGVEYPEEDEPLYNEEDYIDGMNLDFSEETTYSWITTASVSADKTDGNDQSYTKTWEHAIAIGASYSKGFMTLVGSKTGDPMSIGDELEGTLNTAGSTSSSNGRYFELNFAGYETDYVTIDISFVANGSSTRGLGITTSVAKPDANSPAFAQSNGTGEENIVNLSYGQEITTASNRLYITCDASVNIYNVDISIYGEAKPEESSGDDEQSNSQVILFYSGATYPDCVELIPEKGSDGTDKAIAYKSDDNYKYTYNGQSYQPMKLTSSQYVNLTLEGEATVEFYIISGDTSESPVNAQINIFSGKNTTSGTAVKAFTAETMSASFSDTFSAGEYTIMRNNKEMELCYIIITPTAEA